MYGVATKPKRHLSRETNPWDPASPSSFQIPVNGHHRRRLDLACLGLMDFRVCSRPFCSAIKRYRCCVTAPGEHCDHSSPLKIPPSKGAKSSRHGSVCTSLTGLCVDQDWRNQVTRQPWLALLATTFILSAAIATMASRSHPSDK